MGKKKCGGGGGKNSIMNGRALFQYNPDLFKDDEVEEAPTTKKEEEEKTGDDQIQEKPEEEAQVDADLFQDEAGDADQDIDFD